MSTNLWETKIVRELNLWKQLLNVKQRPLVQSAKTGLKGSS